jgi:hypothetical protein
LPAAAVATICSGCQHAIEPAAPAAYKLDNRQWLPVQKNVRPQPGKNFVLELLPAGQSLENWQELVTVEDFSTPKEPIAARSFEKAFLDKLAAGHPGVGYHVIVDSPGMLIFTWQAVSDPRLQSQQGLVRVSSSPQSLHVVEYTSKQALSDEQVENWISILKSNTL